MVMKENQTLIVQYCVASLTSIIAYYLFAHIRLWTSTTTTDKASLFPVGILLFVCSGHPREPRAGFLTSGLVAAVLHQSKPGVLLSKAILCRLPSLPSPFTFYFGSCLNTEWVKGFHKITGAANSRYLKLDTLCYVMWFYKQMTFIHGNKESSVYKGIRVWLLNFLLQTW